MKKNENYLIIGNSVAGIAALEAIRTNYPNAPITVVSKEDSLPVSRPLLPYWLERKIKEEDLFYRNKKFYETNAVNLILNQEVIAIQPKEKRVTLKNKKKISYTHLLIATGSQPIVPPIKGVDKKNVFTFNTVEEIRKLAGVISKAKRAIVLGGGMIGLKVSESLRNLGLSVTIIELANRLLITILDEEAGLLLKEHLVKNGLEIILGNTIREIIGSKKVEGIILNNGTKIPADLVILAIGVKPNLALTKKSGIKTDQGIIVDNFMRTNLKDIYAAGDCTSSPDFFGGQKRSLPLWPLAFQQGRIAGLNMSGKVSRYPGGFSLNSLELFNLPIITAGQSTTEGEPYEIIKKNQLKKKIYKKIIIQANRIIGSILIGDIDRAGIITGLLKDRLDVSSFKEEILGETFGYIYVPKEFRAKMISPLEV